MHHQPPGQTRRLLILERNLAETSDSYLDLPASSALILKSWSAEAYPHEACGLILGQTDGARIGAVRVTQAENLNRDRPEDRYILNPEDFLAADRSARQEGLEIVGIWHTHPDHPAEPSGADLAGAWEGYSYVIITTTASGAVDLRSWRLSSGQFVEETVRREESTP